MNNHLSYISFHVSGSNNWLVWYVRYDFLFVKYWGTLYPFMNWIISCYNYPWKINCNHFHYRVPGGLNPPIMNTNFIISHFSGIGMKILEFLIMGFQKRGTFIIPWHFWYRCKSEFNLKRNCVLIFIILWFYLYQEMNF